MTPQIPLPLSAHLTPASSLMPAVKLWEVYLADKGRSPHTVKAFSADIQLLGGYLPPDQIHRQHHDR